MATIDSNEIISTPNPLDGVPELQTRILADESDKIDALKLVADSIAQQRQAASRAVIFHPLSIAGYVLLMGIVSQYLYKVPGDLGIVLTTCAGVTMAALVAVRGLTAGYIQLAEEITWNYLQNEDDEQDTIIGSRFGDALIGACVLRLERNGSGSGSGSPRKRRGSKGGKGVIRAWTVKMRYRGTGVGTELLEEAVRISRERLGNSAEVGFAAEHANSKMILPEMYNGVFRKGEARAAKALDRIMGIESATRKKR